MTLLELKALLARITYKPGTRYSVRTHSIGGDVDILFTFLVNDACNAFRGEPIPVHSCLRLACLNELTEHNVLHFVERTYRDFEQHEVDEWLKLDGQCINDPHPELKRERVA